MFIDEAQINVRGGDGGAGCVSFLRESRRPKGGPDGGDGGKGGDVVLLADPQVATLLRYTHVIHHKGERGAHGGGKRKHGRAGDDNVVRVPCGTTIRTLEGELLADLVQPGDAYCASHGGRGGRGNARFLSNARRAPTFAEQGEEGEEHWIRLELKLLADVALVGFPNAGKSTFISTVSAARPKIADFPFTTLEPNLGVVTFDDAEFVVADIPGLIEGAAEGKGLGHQFLRHVERSRVLLVLLDPTNHEHTCAAQLRILLDELRRYRPELVDRPRVVAVTKSDVCSADELAAAQRDLPPHVVISAGTGDGVRPLVGDLARLVDESRAKAPEQPGFVVHRPVPSGFEVSRDDTGTWVVDGPDALRAVALSDLTDRQALQYLADRLRRLGVDDALVAAGCGPGDSVVIGDFEFEYVAESEPPARTPHRRAGGGRKRSRRRST